MTKTIPNDEQSADTERTAGVADALEYVRDGLLKPDQSAESVWVCEVCEERFASHYEANQHAKQTHHLVTRPRRIDGSGSGTASSGPTSASEDKS